ncbi:MAG: acetate--CoA ligase family protein [Burkholderiaceae bacterium]
MTNPTMIQASGTLAKLFEPQSVAIIGASDNPAKIGGRPLHLMKAARFEAPIYPINGARRTVQGLRAYASIAEVPAPPDLVIVAVPADQATDAVEQSIQAGAKAIILYSSGFAEVGHEGQELQRRLIQRTRQSGIRLLGPNCLGVINTRRRLVATFSGAIHDRMPEAGSIGLASQSGALGAHCLVLAARRRLSFSLWATSGNEGDIDVAELIAYMALDPQTAVIVACIEGVRDSKRLLHAFDLARGHGKPVVLMKVGASQSGALAAASHTGSMVGSDAVFSAVLEQYGVYRAHSIDEMFDVAYCLSMQRPTASKAITVVTTSGGVGVLMADDAERFGLQVPPLPEAAQAAIRERVPYAGARNPVDVTAQITNTPEVVKPIMASLAEHAARGTMMVFLSHLGLRRPMMQALLPALAELSGRRADDPRIACLLTNDETQDELEALGYSVFEDPTRAMKAAAALAWLGDNSMRQASTAAAAPPDDAPPAQPGRPYSEVEAKQVVAAMGIPVPAERLVHSADDAAATARRLGFPVAMKIVSADIAHKSDVGGVRLSLSSEAEVRQAHADILTRVRNAAPEARIDGLLISRMAPAGVDMILGCTHDETFGPCVMIGFGGVFAEILDDAVIRCAPVAFGEAMAMIGRLKGAAILNGARGSAALDTEALAQAIVRLSRYAAANAGRLASLEINPLRVLPAGSGVLALDALLIAEAAGEEAVAVP